MGRRSGIYETTEWCNGRGIFPLTPLCSSVNGSQGNGKMRLRRDREPQGLSSWGVLGGSYLGQPPLCRLKLGACPTYAVP